MNTIEPLERLLSQGRDTGRPTRATKQSISDQRIAIERSSGMCGIQ